MNVRRSISLGLTGELHSITLNDCGGFPKTRQVYCTPDHRVSGISTVCASRQSACEHRAEVPAQTVLCVFRLFLGMTGARVRSRAARQYRSPETLPAHTRTDCAGGETQADSEW